MILTAFLRVGGQLTEVQSTSRSGSISLRGSSRVRSQGLHRLPIAKLPNPGPNTTSRRRTISPRITGGRTCTPGLFGFSSGSGWSTSSCGATTHGFGSGADGIGGVLPGTTLQVACAYGDLTSELSQRVAAGGGRLDVIDVLPTQLENLRRKLPSGVPARLLAMDSSDLKLPDASYDRVLLFFLLHEQPSIHRERTLSEAFRVVRPGGEIVIVDYARRAGGIRSAFVAALACPARAFRAGFVARRDRPLVAGGGAGRMAQAIFFRRALPESRDPALNRRSDFRECRNRLMVQMRCARRMRQGYTRGSQGAWRLRQNG